jgi:predicted CXXCH cytochrome family protein
MKKLLALAIALFATSTFASVANTSHDLTGTTATGVCMFCHMPHHANTAVTAAPIWSRTVKTSSNYTLKTASGYNLDTTQYSLLCLSCHDGTIATGALWNGTVLNSSAQAVTSTANTGSNVGTVLNDDHPVGVIYPATGSTAQTTGLDTRSNATAAGYLFFTSNGYLECGSCHNPHDNTNGNFYRVGGTTDRCVGCHISK